MDIQINVHNVDLTPRLQSHVEKKTARLDRFMPNVAEIRVDLSSQNARSALERQVAQITIRDERGTILRAEERDSDMFAAVDSVVDKLHRRIKRYRGKQRQSRRGSGEAEVGYGEPLPSAEEVMIEEAETPTIVRRKRFPVRPMGPFEAIEQMELLGHSFFVFFNMDDEAINVVYKRHDGNYGLLQPALD